MHANIHTYVIIYKKARRNAKRVKQSQYSVESAVESSVEKVGLSQVMTFRVTQCAGKIQGT